MVEYNADQRGSRRARRRIGWSVGAIVLALPLMLTACVTGSGSGAPAPTLSASCERHYQSYLREQTPAFFVTDISGRICGYTYCPGQVTNCRAAFPGPILRDCEQQSGRECHVYARGRSISWDGPAATKPGR